METFKCQKCQSEMLTNSFVCKHCEYQIDRENDSHNTHLVRNQWVSREAHDISEETGADYWDHQERYAGRDEEGNIIENPRSNPDVLAEESNELAMDGEGKPQFSRCVFCNGRVFLRKRDGGVKKYVHDAGCWDVFKGEMLRESAI